MAMIRLQGVAVAATLALSAVAFSGVPAVAASNETKTTTRAPISKSQISLPQISLPMSKKAPGRDAGTKSAPASEENQDYMVGEELC